MSTDVYTITIQVASDPADKIPTPDYLQECARHVVASLTPRADICLRIVTPTESQQLNTMHRQQTKPTNVLSFCYSDDVHTQIEGDLILCAQVICREAQLQRKSLSAHWAHMITHGILHLAGFDHELESDAQHMEQQEIKLLAQLGFPNPYQSTTEFTHE